MGFATSLLALADRLDPTLAHWSILMESGKEWFEHSLVGTLRQGQRGVRLLDWGDDIVTTGDVHHVKEIRLHCPDGNTATLELLPGMEPFQFKSRSMDMLGAWGGRAEFMVIGRVVDKATGRCEAFIWDYHPEPEQQYTPAVPYRAAAPAYDDANGVQHAAVPEQLAEPELPYRPAGKHLIAYKSNIYQFGRWKESMTPIGALALSVQGFRL